jgi:hypothetical protein
MMNLPIIYRFFGLIYRFSTPSPAVVGRQIPDRKEYSSTNRKPIHRNRKPDGQRFIGGGIAAGGELSDNRPMVRPNRQISCLLRAYRNIPHSSGPPEQSSGDRWKEYDP